MENAAFVTEPTSETITPEKLRQFARLGITLSIDALMSYSTDARRSLDPNADGNDAFKTAEKLRAMLAAAQEERK